MSDPTYFYRLYGKELLKPEDKRVIWPRRRGLRRWLAPLFWGEAKAPWLCRKCRSRNLNFRQLLKEPSGALCDEIDEIQLCRLERKNTVHIKDFLYDEAKANESHCSLCRLLVVSLKMTYAENWLLRMPCLCMLRPRYDWVTYDRKKGKLVHRYQIWVEFQPIDQEMSFDLDMTYVQKQRPLEKGRWPAPPTIDLGLLRQWLQQCDGEHSHPGIPRTVVSRMQKILGRGVFRAINTSTGSVEALTSLQKYAALSYVWGPTTTTTTEESGYQPLESRPISAYVPTIRDAAVIARSVGLQWIWVDRICIDQTSESDKAMLISYMKDIYAAAYLTIVAGSSENAQSGLPGAPGTPRPGERPLMLGSSVALLPSSAPLGSLIDTCSWSKRGWTFEEHIFSRRLLYILRSEVYFRCMTHNFRETNGCRYINLQDGYIYRGIVGEGKTSSTMALYRSLHRRPENTSAVLDTYQFIKALEEYSKRDLTFERDRVNAFAGVLIAAINGQIDEASERAMLSHGHPPPFFELLLTWGHGHGQGPIDEPPLSNNPYMPTWSWASSPLGIWFTPVRNKLMEGGDPWFQYTLLCNHDILGLPTDSNQTSQILGLEPPDGLIADQPWMKGLSDKPPFDHAAGSSPGSVPRDSPSLPVLHLVTVVFEARLLQEIRHSSEFPLAPNDKYLMTTTDCTKTMDEIKRSPDIYLQPMETWSLAPQLESRYSAAEAAVRPRPFDTFAIITGRAFRSPDGRGVDTQFYDLYVMLLDPPGQHDTYTRVGLTRLPRSKDGCYGIEVMKKGRPRWQHIRIA